MSSPNNGHPKSPAIPDSMPDSVRNAFEHIPKESREMVVDYFVGLATRTSFPSETGFELTNEYMNNVMTLEQMKVEQEGRKTELLYADKKGSRRTSSIIFGGIIAFLVFVIIFLNSNPDLIKTIIDMMSGAAAGFFSGWGFAKWQDKSKNE